jgi:transposase-like protein
MCPQCRSDNVKIKRVEGIERIVALLTWERKYRCRNCGLGFRAPDRRKFSRDAPLAFDPIASGDPVRKKLS